MYQKTNGSFCPHCKKTLSFAKLKGVEKQPINFILQHNMIIDDFYAVMVCMTKINCT
jgi:glutaredoxin